MRAGHTAHLTRLPALRAFRRCRKVLFHGLLRRVLLRKPFAVGHSYLFREWQLGKDPSNLHDWGKGRAIRFHHILDGAPKAGIINDENCRRLLIALALAGNDQSPFVSLRTCEVSLLKTNSRSRFDTALAPVPAKPLNRTSEAPRSEAG
jgi:hypothetical protein